jgi:hypothetical protein
MRATHQQPVKAAQHDDLPDLVGLTAAYEWDSPAAAWLIPDVRSRPGVLMAWYMIQAEQALSHGYVDMTEDRRAAAIWLDRTRPAPALANYLRRLTSMCGRHAVNLLTYEHLLAQQQPRGGHLRLVALAGAPADAAALLMHRHRPIDESAVPAYATASTSAQCRVLTAAGYVPAPPCRLPGGPDIWPLQRQPAIDRPTA